MSKVYLVGAGPGDPGLLTLKGQRLLARAGVVLYDHLANEALLAHAPAGAEKIYVGKKRSCHAYTQQQIIELMVDRGRRGINVVRLKGGDPFIFGRGGEEVEALAAAGVPYEVVPGVTAPLGIAAYTGVPLTHREHTSVVTFVTGHDPGAVDWARIADAETLVIFMGLHCIGEIAKALIAAGRSGSTPAMAVRWGTRPDQQTLVGLLSDIPRLVREHGMTPPATVIVGDVVALHDRLDWFSKLPLVGQKIVVTRPRAQSMELIEELQALGADVLELPAIELAPLEDYADLDRCIARLPEYDWLVFTSANAVEHFLRRLDLSPLDARAFRGKVCAIGEATAEAISRLHWKVDLIPDEAVAESVVDAFARIGVEGKRVLLPKSAAARDVIAKGLSALGAAVDAVDAYRNIVPAGARERAAEVLSHRPDWITFTSSSTVKNVLALAGPEALKGVQVATIGPVTSDTVRRYGLTVHAQAGEAGVAGLIAAILAK